jgi:hypothetical protein
MEQLFEAKFLQIFAMNKALFISALVYFAAFFAAAQSEEQAARLILHKVCFAVSCDRFYSYRSVQVTETEPVVEGRDFVVKYKLINTGDATATNIEIQDKYDTIS